MSEGKNRRILVVEDERDGQAVVAGILERTQIACDLATTAEEAVRLLTEWTYDAALIDLALPGMNGFDLVQHIRRNPATAQLPCIAYTAYHTSKVRQDAIDSGFNVYFEKPLRGEILIKTLQRIMA